jgi:LPS sulfotransferase NodH
MKSLERRFKKLASENPAWSTFTCFSGAVSGQNFSKDRLRRWFRQLVSEDDYATGEAMAVLAFLEHLNKDPRSVPKTTPIGPADA